MPKSSSSSSSSSSDGSKKNKKKSTGNEEPYVAQNNDNYEPNNPYPTIDDQNVGNDPNNIVNEQEDLNPRDDNNHDGKKGPSNEFGDSKSKIEEVYLWIVSICCFLAALSITVIILGVLLKMKFVGACATYLIVFGLASLFVFIYGIWACWQYNNIVLEKGENYADQSPEREFFIKLIR